MKARGRAAILVVFAAIAFTNVARNPRFEAFHMVDILGLIAAGMCLGASLPILMGKLKSRGE
jgi:hypothetical protein